MYHGNRDALVLLAYILAVLVLGFLYTKVGCLFNGLDSDDDK